MRGRYHVRSLLLPQPIFYCLPPVFRWIRGPASLLTSSPPSRSIGSGAEQRAENKPSLPCIVLPEAYLGTPQEDARLQSIRRTMEDYRHTVLTRKVHGYVYVERTQMDGTIRQGLVGAVDLEAYDYTSGAKPAIRPSESTVVERIPAPEGAPGCHAGDPHVMMLADDAGCTLIEPIGQIKDTLPPLYDGS